MQRIARSSLVAALGLSLFSGCTAAPRVRNVEMGPVDTGGASVEAVRRQLKGTWQLTALTVFTPAGETVVPDASGRLQYDEYGNLSMKGTIGGSTAVDPSVLNLTGRVAIDPTAHTLRILDVAAKSADERRVDPQLDAKHTRYYAFEGDLLKTTVKAANGTTTAMATWKKID